jgi:hypothetical protein
MLSKVKYPPIVIQQPGSYQRKSQSTNKSIKIRMIQMLKGQIKIEVASLDLSKIVLSKNYHPI